MRPLYAIAQAVVADAIRRKVVWVVLIFAALLAFAVPSLPSYGQGVVSSVFREVTIALMYVTSLVVAVAFGTTRIPAEVERRTVFTVLSKDVRRWHYVAGTWAGMFVVTGVVLLAFTVVALATGLVVYKEFMPVLLLGALAVWFEMGVIMALAVLVSSWYNPITAVVAALAFLFIGHTIPGLVAPPGTDAPWWLPSLQIFDVVNPVAHGSGYGLLYGVSMFAAFVAWVALLLVGASALFARRDL